MNDQATDCEAITEEWLRSVGFVDGNFGVLQRGLLFCDLHAVRTFGCSLWWYIGQSIHRNFAVRKPETRGEVIELCRLLGSPVNIDD